MGCHGLRLAVLVAARHRGPQGSRWHSAGVYLFQNTVKDRQRIRDSPDREW